MIMGSKVVYQTFQINGSQTHECQINGFQEPMEPIPNEAPEKKEYGEQNVSQDRHESHVVVYVALK